MKSRSRDGLAVRGLNQSSLLLWVGVVLNGIFLLRSLIGKAFAAQISSFVEVPLSKNQFTIAFPKRLVS